MLTCLHSCQSCPLDVTVSQQHGHPPGGIIGKQNHSQDGSTDRTTGSHSFSDRTTEAHGFSIFLQYYHALYGLLNELLVHHTSVVLEAIPAFIAAAKHILL